MRILYWVENFLSEIGGMEVLAYHYLRALRARGHQVLVVTSRPDREPELANHERIPVRRFPFAQVLSRGDRHEMASLCRELIATKQAFRAQIVHLNFNFRGPSCPVYQNVPQGSLGPTLVTAHVPVNDRMLAISRAAQRVVAVSNSLLGDILAAAPDLRSRAAAVSNALAMPAVQLDDAARREPAVLLCVGRISGEKGFDVALEALARLDGECRAVRLVVAGDGPERSRLERRATELGLGERVSFIGWVAPERVPELMRGASIVVMPSRWREPFGLVALQAAQVGVPCVASAVGGIPEIVQHRETGLLVEPNDPAALAQALAQLISDRNARRAMGRAARERAVRTFSIDDLVRRYEALYVQALALPKRHKAASERSQVPRIRRSY